MIRKLFLTIAAPLLLLLLPTAAAQDAPTVAILSMAGEFALQEGGILDVLQAYQLIDADERAALNRREDLEGEHINIRWGSATSVADANILVESVIDGGVDALLTLTTPMSQIAVNITNQMDAPPIVLFSAVANPFNAGLADSRCVKPAHVTGSYSFQDYQVVYDSLLMQYPDLQQVGLIFASGDAVSEEGAEQAMAIGEAMGIEVLSAAVAELSELTVAADGVISRGAEAIIMPATVALTPGYGIVVEAGQDASVPVVASSLPPIYMGATFGFGQFRILQEGYDVARVLVAWLNGEADIATTGLNAITDSALGMNLNSAQLADVEVSGALMEQADAIIVGDQYQFSPRMAKDAFGNLELPDQMIMAILQAANIPGLSIVGGRIQMPLAAVIGEASGFSSGNAQFDPAIDAAFIAALECTPDMIAEQQTALEAASE